MPNRVKGFIVQLLRHRMLGIPASLATARLGATDLAHPRECRYVPPIVRFKVPGAGDLKFHSAGGTDRSRSPCSGRAGITTRPLPLLWVERCRGARAVSDIGAYTGFFAILAAAAGCWQVVA